MAYPYDYESMTARRLQLYDELFEQYIKKIKEIVCESKRCVLKKKNRETLVVNVYIKKGLKVKKRLNF